MTHILMRYTVEDWKSWKPVFDSNRHTRVKEGVKEEHVFQGTGNPNEVTLLFRWDNIKRARTFLGSDDLKKRMLEAGVHGKPDIHFLDEVEHRAS